MSLLRGWNSFKDEECLAKKRIFYGQLWGHEDEHRQLIEVLN